VQRDLGTGLLLFGLFVCELYVAAPRWDYLLLGILALAGGSIVSYRLFDHVRVRFDIWLNPWEHASGQGYQLVQAMLSTSAGVYWEQVLGKDGLRLFRLLLPILLLLLGARRPG